jgi:hypothetical protein
MEIQLSRNFWKLHHDTEVNVKVSRRHDATTTFYRQGYIFNTVRR